MFTPSEKPGERQRAWLIAGEPSDPDEPGRQRAKVGSRSIEVERFDPFRLNQDAPVFLKFDVDQV